MRFYKPNFFGPLFSPLWGYISALFKLLALFKYQKFLRVSLRLLILSPDRYFCSTKTGVMTICSFMSVKVTKMKGNRNNNNNSYSLSYQTRNSKKTSNSHVSGSSGPKISIWGSPWDATSAMKRGGDFVNYAIKFFLLIFGEDFI